MPKQPPRVLIEHPEPRVDCGRYAAKRCVGDEVVVGADIFRDGHQVLAGVVRWWTPGADRKDVHEAPLAPVDAEVGGVRWEGSFTVDRPGRWSWSVEAWADDLASWRREVDRKLEARQPDLGGELAEGAVLLAAAAKRAKRAKDPEAGAVADAASLVADAARPDRDRLAAALDPAVAAICRRHPDRRRSASLAPVDLDVDPPVARFGAWYELFPRSWGGLTGARAQVATLAALGFDVLYLPPIHPIGHTNRKGRNNSLEAAPGDPGSPWAIGSEEGGHRAVHPDLGTLDDVAELAAECERRGMRLALDFAVQCSADHPWLAEHPEWFDHRPDGTLKYAENPPKRYQDIYNLNFDCEDWRGLWEALLGVVEHWIDHGVTVFRVDNPHTKPVAFWEWLIAEVRGRRPDVVFLAEAFTHRAMMRTLAKAGFNQSYTYFTWKHAKWELQEYLTELTTSGEQEYFRPNFFVNTPDILTAELVEGGPPKFVSRLVLAATLSPSYGVYSGFESFERDPVRPGSEEYLDSEKYEVKERALDGPLLPLIERLNRARRRNPALQQLTGLRFLETENEAIIAYAKTFGDNTVVTVVSLDPEREQEGVVVVPESLGVPPAFEVVDELNGKRYEWRLGRNYVGLAPYDRQAHVLRVEQP